jgi:hypothetical protein
MFTILGEAGGCITLKDMLAAQKGVLKDKPCG